MSYREGSQGSLQSVTISTQAALSSSCLWICLTASFSVNPFSFTPTDTLDFISAMRQILSTWLILRGIRCPVNPAIIRLSPDIISAKAYLIWAMDLSFSWVNLLNTDALAEKARIIFASLMPESLLASATRSLSVISLNSVRSSIFAITASSLQNVPLNMVIVDINAPLSHIAIWC